jgi:CheY-like chemotaxis protein
LRISRAAPPPANPYAESILLLGGGRDMARLLERHIGEGDQGYRVLVADSAEQTRHLAAQDHPQAVICNLSLAKLRALTAELLPRELPPEVPVVYTAIPCAAWRAELLEVKASLQKPVERADLLALLRQVPGVRDVLIVDDDLGFAQMVARMLEATVDEGGEPLRVRMAFGGSEGLEAMRRRPPDLLLLDLRMPEPDGLAVLAAMRAEPILRNVPVVVVTAGDVYDEPGALPIGLVAVAQRGGWGLRDSLKALAALLEVARPSYGEPRSEREEGEMGMATTAADQMAARHGPTLARA